ncbi:MAG: hemerythrin family protein [Leptospiraceae bacterium]|nr:hemerythrin family protein [Leptospiraceae bacterium]
MKRLEWSVQYSVGVPKLDQQHAYLFELADRLSRHLGDERAAQVINETIADLHKYVDQHFAYEEAVMQSAGYAGLEEHRKAHALMRTRLELFTAQLRQGVLDRQAFIKFVEDWLTEHILHEDAKYIPAISALET